MIKKIIIRFFAASCLLVLCCCAAMPQEDRETRNNDVLNRFSPHTLTAMQSSKMFEDFIILRKNKTFVYRTKVLGFINSSYYCGNYTFSHNILTLQFEGNRKPADCDLLYVPVLKKGGVYFEGASTSFAVVDNYYPYSDFIK